MSKKILDKLSTFFEEMEDVVNWSTLEADDLQISWNTGKHGYILFETPDAANRRFSDERRLDELEDIEKKADDYRKLAQLEKETEDLRQKLFAK